MDENSSNKSRRERRREARLSKNKKKFDSWVQHQKSWKALKSSLNLNSEKVCKLEEDEKDERKYDVSLALSDKDIEDSIEEPQIQEKFEGKLSNLKRNAVIKGSKSKFNEYLEREMKGGALLVKEDLKLEKKLAKKLKVKNGKLKGADDDMDMLLEGIPSILSNLEEDEEGIERNFDNGTLHKKRKTSKFADIESKAEKLADNVDEESYTLDAISDEHDDVAEVVLHKDSKKRNRKKTKFEEYLETERQGDMLSGEADLALEKKLAKNLKVKKGRLSGENDDINMLFKEIPSVLDSLRDELITSDEDPKKSIYNSYSGERLKKRKSIDQEKRAKVAVDPFFGVSKLVEPSGAEVTSEQVCHVPGKYVAPHLRSQAKKESEDAQIRRQIRGLLNRLSESNLESITGEIFIILKSVGRSVGSQIVHEEVVASCSGGPRGNKQYAAVFAAFVAGMACLVGIDFGAKLLACLAKCFEEEYHEEDNLSLRNLTLLFSYLYIFGVCSSELVYDFLTMLSKRLTEVDVSTVLTVMQTCGMKLRGDDPVEMKNFISSVQSRVNEMKACSGDGQSNITSKRMDFMLEMICDIKNNKKRPTENAVQHTRIKKWLQELRVVDILIRGLKWSKLLDPNKKGQWWLSGDIDSSTHNIEEVASTIDREVSEAQKMLQLAAAQRMNTDARRAIFCVIMSGEDYADAFEKLLRLDLPGKLDREIMRVLVECCLQEKVFNKYYCVLASKLCNHDKNFKFTLQYCVWDHFKELEAMDLQRSMHLSKFIAEMISTFCLSLAVLKVVELNNPILLTPKKIMHFRMLFEAILEFPDKLVWNMFTRIAVTPEYESLRVGIDYFISKHVLSLNKSLANKYKLAKKALNNVEGVLM
ncbi:nucleolar MIF4G domain-containing 1 [Olea europaea subsp. europaea]|uniref:Nucleolar MIF4G domain-containing 1 n=1 Tax=Olea europaea subsp. europaea TaxID=158383 RepID=A0A8S0R369_OLEEU|nr:nucleolar MIF4G domain-containing 1 [Olea europaea subsp. europaea]